MESAWVCVILNNRLGGITIWKIGLQSCFQLLGGILCQNDWSQMVDPTVRENKLDVCQTPLRFGESTLWIYIWAGLQPMREEGVWREKEPINPLLVNGQCYEHARECYCHNGNVSRNLWHVQCLENFCQPLCINISYTKYTKYTKWSL